MTAEFKVPMKKGEINTTMPYKVHTIEYWKRDAEGNWIEYKSKLLDMSIVGSGPLNEGLED